VDKDRLERIEQKLDHLLRLVESIAVSQEQRNAGDSQVFQTDIQKQSAVPARELRKWPEINFRGPRLPSRSK
jgi:hypothetical protein